ncbi:MAG TPA: hypothetical protein VEK73_15865 [Xanthobacteraceae bacterium]|nr:hypothetical protein [Xanthobacteraceae bacterium]
MDFAELLARHPEVGADRHGLVFARGAERAAAAAYRRHGVVQLRNALAPDFLAGLREKCLRAGAAFDPASAAAEGFRTGKGNNLWDFRLDGYVLAPFFAAMTASWAWAVVQEICGSADIVFFTAECAVRHVMDETRGLGAHQDAVNVSHDMPFAIWVPLHDAVPGRDSALGFIANGERALIDPQDFPAHMLAHRDDLWMPTYRAGDLTIHDKMTPHYTTGFGTGSERISVELRCAERRAAMATQHVRYHLFVGRDRRVAMRCPWFEFRDVRPFLEAARSRRPAA